MSVRSTVFVHEIAHVPLWIHVGDCENGVQDGELLGHQAVAVKSPVSGSG